MGIYIKGASTFIDVHLKIKRNAPGYWDKPREKINNQERSACMTEVFCRYIRKNGKIIYPKKGKFFHFWTEDNEKDPVVEPNLIHVEE